MGEWKKYTIKDVTSILGDGIHGTPKYDDNGPVFFINGNNLENGKIVIRENTKRVSIEESIKHKKQLTNRTILVSINGTLGNVARYNGEPCILGKSACYFNVKEDFDIDFIYYVVANETFRKEIERLATGTTIKNVSLETMRNYSFIAPSIVEQKNVASILSSFDDKIEVNMRINENLEQQAQALFKSWFVDYEPFRSKPFVESEIGMIPEGWSVVSLGEILEENTKSKIQVKQARDIKGEYPFFTSGTTVLEYDEFLVSGRNIFLNTGGVAGVNFYIGKAAYSTDTWCIKGKDDLTDFLYLYLSSVIDIINTQYFEGSALKHLKKKALKERKIAIPSMYIIDGFIKSVMPLFDKMISNKRQNRILSQLRDTLLPRLMSGELKVKDIEDSL